MTNAPSPPTDQVVPRPDPLTAFSPAPQRPSRPSRWPGPSGQADRMIIVGALVTGLAAAVSVPLDRPGLGWAVAAVVAVGCAVVAAVRTAAPRPGPARIGWALVALALLGAGTIRAASWLFVLCVLTAAVAGSLAAAGGGRGLAGLVAGAVAWPVAGLRSLPWAERGVRTMGGAGLRTGASIAVTVVLLLVFGSLFASADPAFERLVSAGTPDLRPDMAIRSAFLFVAGALALLGAAFLIARPPDLDGLESPGSGRLRLLEWGLPVIALNLLFLMFVAVQFTVLFGGAAHVLGPGGPDFAEHARGGFWQLLAVTMLTLGVLAVAARWAHRETLRERVLIRVLLGSLGGLTLVVVASALYRMHVYEEAYGFTRLRLLVSAFELWLGVVFALVLAAGAKLRAPWLPSAAAGAAAAALLGLVALNPDAFIAERNIDRYAKIDRIDVDYLSGLSADAAPALTQLPAELRGCALRRIDRELAQKPDDWREFNLARSRARAILADDPLSVPPC